MDPQQATAPMPPEPPPIGGATGPGVGYRTAFVALGTAGRAWDLALGAVLEAQDAATGLIGDLRRAQARAQARERARMATLAGRGARERARWRQRAVTAVDSVVMAVATAPAVDRAVDAQLDRVLRPVVRAVLDDVLLLLQEEPERIQVLIRGQRDGMVDEVVGRIRTGAASGDTAVDRLTARIFRHGRSPLPQPPLAPDP